MKDPPQVYGLINRLLEQMQADLMGEWKLWLLLLVTVAVGWRVAFAWLGGVLSGPEALALCSVVGLAEAGAAGLARDFPSPDFILLLALPFALWAGVEVMSRVSSREARRSNLRGDMERLRGAIRRDPKNTGAHVLMGDAHLKLGQPQRALAEYWTALALSPGDQQLRWKVKRASRLAVRSPRMKAAARPR